MLRVVIVVLVLCRWAAHGAELVLDFHDDPVNQVPRGFRSALAGTGQPGDWKVLLEDAPSLMAPVSPLARPLGKRPVLAQLARERTDEHFPLCLYEGETFGDFSLTTRFKLVDGTDEQMAGIAFRVQDERNYYYIRASGLGNTFYFFKVVDGVRGPPVGNNIPIARGTWHEMKIECRGTKVRAFFNGKEVIPQLDDKSFSNGKIGFWTKSDAVTYFADTVIEYKPHECLAQILVKDAYKKYPRLLGLKIFAGGVDPGGMRVVASLDPQEVGTMAPAEVADVLTKQGYWYGKSSGTVILTLPLHDNNGDKVAAVRVEMKSFLGQTEKNAVARAMPVVQSMENRIQTLKDLVQ